MAEILYKQVVEVMPLALLRLSHDRDIFHGYIPHLMPTELNLAVFLANGVIVNISLPRCLGWLWLGFYRGECVIIHKELLVVVDDV